MRCGSCAVREGSGASEVLDASLALSWCFKDEKTAFTEAVLRALPVVGAAVPSLRV